MDCNMPGFPVHHQLPEFTQTHVHWVSDAIQPSHPLPSSPSPPALNLSQHQSLFTWVSSLPQVAKVLKFKLQHQSLQWIFRTDFNSDGVVGSPCNVRDSQDSSSTPQFRGINSLVLSFLYSPTSPYMITVMYGCELLRMAHIISCLDLWNSFPGDLFLLLYLQTVATLSGF